MSGLGPGPLDLLDPLPTLPQWEEHILHGGTVRRPCSGRDCPVCKR